MNLTFSSFGYVPAALASSGCDCADCDCSNAKTVQLLGPPITNTLPVTGCTQHQAPSGYKYVNQNGACVLATMAGVPIPALPLADTTTVIPAAVTNTVTSITDQIKALYASNPYLVYAGIGLGLYLLSKKK